jgi:SAM-dependent methyltransferase
VDAAYDPCMTPDEQWLDATWPFVRDHLPAAPGAVLEVGCGSLGGFVASLRRDGYDAVGVDPQAPGGRAYRRVKLEQCELPRPVDAVIACTSLHHVDDLDSVADRLREVLLPRGVVIVVEWAWERVDEATARWCFGRLAPTALSSDPGWLHRRRDEWADSGQPWGAYWRSWATGARLHPGREILQTLDARFDRVSCADGPYFFPELDGITESDEQAAIEAAQAQATCIRYVGTVRS